MKFVVVKIFHWIKLCIVASMLLLTLVWGLLHFVGYQLDKYNQEVASYISNMMSQPVWVGHIALGSRGLEPVFKLYDVIIFNDAKNKKLLRAEELQVGIDLIGSVLQWRIKPGLLRVRGSVLSIRRNENGEMYLDGISAGNAKTMDAPAKFEEFSSWLLDQSNISLDRIELHIILDGGKTMHIDDFSLKMHNGVLQHQLKVSGALKQDGDPAVFAADLKIRGNLADAADTSLVGDLEIANWLPKFDQGFSGDSTFVLPSGDINLQLKNAVFKINELREPLVATSVSTRFVWQRENSGLRVDFSRIKFIGAHLNLYGNCRMLFSKSSRLPFVDIDLNLELDNLANAKLYYPINLLPVNTTQWLDQAFASSRLLDGKLVLQGPLSLFPFDHGEGDFFVNTNIRDVNLNYDSAWPRVDDITGKMLFSKRTMTITTKKAKILGAPVKFIKVVIPDLERPILQVQGAIDANSKTGLKFLNLSPLKVGAGYKLQYVDLAGPMKFQLKMDMPLSSELKNLSTQVWGDIELQHNELYSKTWNLTIGDINGKLHFHNGSLIGKNIKGILFNQQLELDINTLHPDTDHDVTQLSMRGNIAAEDFAKFGGAKAFSCVSGNFNYDVLLELHRLAAKNIFELKSDLVGIAIDLPEPFNKKASDAALFTLSGYLGDSHGSRVFVNYKDIVSAALLVKKLAVGSFKIFGGDIKINAGKTHSFEGLSSGLVVLGKLEKVNWPKWQECFKKIGVNIAGNLPIRRIKLNISELTAFERIFKRFFCNAERKNSGWDIGLVTESLEGRIFLPDNKAEVIQGVFKRIGLNKDENAVLSLRPQDILPMDLKIDSFYYDGNKFTKVELVTTRKSNRIKIDKIKLNGALFGLDASGEWLDVNGKQSSVLNGKIASNDIGALAKSWSITNNLIGGKGDIDFTLRWPNAPYAPTLKSIVGTLLINVSDGRVINLNRQAENKLGFSKVLSVLSLQSLPRRLTLDFSDLTKKGFGFDRLSGELVLEQGNASTKSLLLNGQAALVKAYGRIGLVAQDYDLMLSVAPKVTSSLPLAAAIVGGPVVGVLGLVADNVISSALKKAVVYNYSISGTWDEPNIVKKP